MRFEGLKKGMFLLLTCGVFCSAGMGWAQEAETSYDVSAAGKHLGKGIVASYKGGTITLDEWKTAWNAFPMERKFGPMNPPESVTKRAQIKELAYKRIFLQNAIQSKMDKDAIYIKAFNEASERNLLETLFEKLVRDKSTPSSADMKKYYDENKAQFITPESFSIRYIFVDTSSTKRKTPEQLAEGLKKINDAYAELKKGSKFEDVAVKYSETAEEQRGHVAGPFQVGKIAKPLEKTALELEPGQFSSILTTKTGYHIIQLDEHKLAFQNSFEDVKEQINQILSSQSMKKYADEVLSNSTTAYVPKIKASVVIDSTAKASAIVMEMPGYKMTLKDYQELALKYQVPQGNMETVNSFLGFIARNKSLVLYAKKNKLDKDSKYTAKMNDFKTTQLSDKWLTSQVDSKFKLTDQEIQAYYNSNSTLFNKEKEYLPLNIYIKATAYLAKDNPNKLEAMNIAKDTAVMIIEALKKGAKFDELAKQYSMLPNAKDGGAIDWLPMGPMGHRFDMAMDKLKKGEFTTTPVEMPDGYQIILLQDIRDSRPMSFEEAKPLAQQRAEFDKKEKLKQAIIQDAFKSVNFVYDFSAL